MMKGKYPVDARLQVDVLKKVHDGTPALKLTSLSDGEIFGESEMIAGGKRSTTVRCATPVQVSTWQVFVSNRN